MAVQASLFYWPIKSLRGDISMFWQDFIGGAMTTKLLEEWEHPQSSLRDQVSHWFITGTLWILLLPKVLFQALD